MAATKKAQTRLMTRLDKKFLPEGMEYPFLSKFRAEGCNQPGLSCSAENHPHGRGAFCRVELLGDLVSPMGRSPHRPALFVAASICDTHRLELPWPTDPRFTLNAHGSVVLHWSMGERAKTPSEGKWRKAGRVNFATARPSASEWEARNFMHRVEAYVTPHELYVEATDTCETCGRAGEAEVVPAPGGGRRGGSWATSVGEKILDKILREEIFKVVPKVMTEDFLAWHYLRRNEALDARNQASIDRELRFMETAQRKRQREVEHAVMAAGIKVLS